ncbi:MAG: aldo/keto reductase, partial [Paramuribaculum sp.]|nr:aldo/keto reductase [Paramuribaculum sp.]
VLDYCYENGIGFISFSPLAQGVLTSKYLNKIPEGSRMSRSGSLKPQMLTPALHDYIDELNAASQQQGLTIAELALAWVQAQRGVTSVIVGASSVEQLACNLQSPGGIDPAAVPLPGKNVSLG